MFSKDLSLSILQLCSSRDLSYEKAAELCGLGCYPVCPYCKLILDREYLHFCDRCGQELDWKDYSNAIIIFPSRS